MTNIDHGIQGAHRATWRTVNPRALLQEIANNNPKVDRDGLHELFWNEIKEDADMLRAIVEYWLDNNIQSLIRRREIARPPTKSLPRAESVERATRQMRERVNYEARIQLLELVMPNNKVLADCTGAECKKFGGWYRKLAERVPRNKTVGEVLTEDQVWKLWKPK